MNKTIALLTDFGLQDIYVGVMKGVMLGISPEVNLVDITHAVPPQSVRGGAMSLLNSYQYFPDATVFLVVVDPGVGSSRNPIAVKAGPYHFVAPDNGVLSYTLQAIGDYEAVVLENRAYRVDTGSFTFHGRDIFAPAAAYLSRGDVPLQALGSRLAQIFSLPSPEVEIDNGLIRGEVTHIDHFGNVITSIGSMRWVDDYRLILENAGRTVRIDAREASVRFHNHEISRINRAYYEVPRGNLLAQIDSNGYLEMALNQGNAALRLDAEIGDVVDLILS